MKALAALALLVPLWLPLWSGCGDSGDSPQLNELNDSEYVTQCNAARGSAGMAATVGVQHFGCYFAASAIGGTCNTTIFDSCVGAAPSPCLAPGSNDPIRQCTATVTEGKACVVALAKQYAAYQGVTCAAPPSGAPKPAKEVSECAALCAKCPTYEGCS
jgi:hypothetical protein